MAGRPGRIPARALGRLHGLKLPDDAEEKQSDYVMCADIFPTGWHATELAGMKPGDAVVIYGAGPVGLMAAHSAMIKGACSVMVVDCHSDRLKLAESIGAIAIDYSKEDPVQRVMDLTHGRARTWVANASATSATTIIITARSVPTSR
jgi:threonine dehydrogenase-like Zn-dependent dehydrogenase